MQGKGEGARGEAGLRSGGRGVGEVDRKGVRGVGWGGWKESDGEGRVCHSNFEPLSLTQICAHP